MNQARYDLVLKTLQDKLNPTQCELIDDSHHHIGHAGAASGMSHYTVKISADQFAERSMIEKHRIIYDALGDLMNRDIHALKIEII